MRAHLTHYRRPGFLVWSGANRIKRIYANSDWSDREWDNAILSHPETAALDLLRGANSKIATRPQIFIPRDLLATFGFAH